MVKTNITITSHEDKTSQGGKDYTRFQTNLGWMSCFEKDVIDNCKANENKVISLETAESVKDGKTFHNIRGFYEVVSGSTTEQLDEAIKSTDNIIKEVTSKKPTDIQVGTSVAYAKDVICACIKAGVEKPDTKKLAKSFLKIQMDLLKEE